MTDTNAIIARSIFLYELENSMIMTKRVVSMEPHNLFLHSEVIQSHEYNKQDEGSIRKVLKYEFYDTLFSMIVGWAINSAMILLAAATFFKTIRRWRSYNKQSRCLIRYWGIMPD